VGLRMERFGGRLVVLMERLGRMIPVLRGGK
jgi:hypothetical protein